MGSMLDRLCFQTVPPNRPGNRTYGWHWNAGLTINIDDKGIAPSEEDADEEVINFLRELKGSLEAHLETISEVLRVHEEEEDRQKARIDREYYKNKIRLCFKHLPREKALRATKFSREMCTLLTRALRAR